MSKILCPNHNDTVPSMEVYSNFSHCFVCGYHVRNEKIGVNRCPRKAFKTDIKRRLEYINTLPTKEIRGLELPYDNEGYYIVYPNVEYYAKRYWEAENRTKYQYPAGHKRQPLVLYSTNREMVLFIIEGQLNALSAGRLHNNCTISPGSATDMANSDLISKYYLHYSHICIIVDKDIAGVRNGVKLRDILLKAGKKVVLYAMPKDLNDILVEHGKEAVKEEINKVLALF